MNTQEKILAILKELHDAHPHPRFGQLIHNATSGADIFYWSDEKLLEALEAEKTRFKEIGILK